MSKGRFFDSATLLTSGKVLVAGGVNADNNGDLASAETYDPASDAWSPAGPMTTARVYATATLLKNGKVLVAGGYNYADWELNSAELYDPASNTWSSAGSMSVPRNEATSTLLPDGDVLVAGGYDRNGNYWASADLYHPDSNTWTAAAPMRTGRAFHTATLLANGTVLVAGGQLGSGQPTAAAELYDPSNNTWSDAAPLSTGRYMHTATLMSDGRVLVVGGDTGHASATSGSDVASAEIYDPVAGTWSAAGSLTTSRDRHTATLLADGNVLVAGGNHYGPGDAPGPGFGHIASAERYSPPAAAASPPDIQVTQPTENEEIPIGQYIKANYACLDDVDVYPSPPTCVGTAAYGDPIDTATTGAHSFTVTSTDSSGNTATKTVRYTVTAFRPPSGRLIAYTTNNGQLFFAREDGSGAVQVGLPGAGGSAIDFSPDGTRFAYAVGLFEPAAAPTENPKPYFEIHTRNVDGTDDRLVLRQSGYGGSPKYSPDGSRIEYQREDADTLATDIWLVDTDGSDLHQLTNEPDGNAIGDGSWSPDGAWVVAERSSTTGYGFDIVKISASDGSVTQLTSTPGNETGPRYSRDGQWVYFTANAQVPSDFQNTLQRVHPDGTGREQISALGTGQFGTVVFSPDGTSVLMPYGISSPSDIYRVDLATGAKTQLTNTPNISETPVAWQGPRISLDTTPPSVTVTRPREGEFVWQGSNIAAGYGCTDSAPGDVSCTGDVANGQPLDTSTIGDHVFKVRAVDAAGNITTKSVHFTVVAPHAPEALVSNYGSSSVTPISLNTNTAGPPIAVPVNPRAIAVTADGTTGVVATNAGLVTIDLATNATTAPIPYATGNPIAMTLAPDGKTAYVLGGGQVAVVSLVTRAVTKVIGTDAYSTGIVLSPDQKSIYVSHELAATVSKYTLATGKEAATIAVPGQGHPGGLVFGADNRTLFLAREAGGAITPIDTKTNAVGPSFGASGGILGDIHLSPDGGTLYTLQDGLFAFDVVTHASSGPGAPLTTNPWSFALAPDSTQAIVTGPGDAVTPIDLTTFNVGAPLPVGQSPFYVATTPASLVARSTPVISTQPASTTAYAGQAATFTAAASGVPRVYQQWQVSTDAGQSFSDIRNQTGATLTVTATAATNAPRYRVVFTNAAGQTTSRSAVLTVKPVAVPVFTKNPADMTVLTGHKATFSVTVTGTPTPTIQWQASTDGGATFVDLPGQTAASLAVTPTASQDQMRYRARALNLGGQTTSSVAVLHVQVAPKVTANPADVSAAPGGTATFVASASGQPNPGVRWQSAPSGSNTFTDIPGATTPTLAISAAASNDKSRYRAVFTNPAGSATTTAARLTIKKT